MTDEDESPSWPKRLLAEHKIQSALRPEGGWDWSCSCGEKGHSADQRDHWADVMINLIKEGEIERYGAVSHRTPEHWRDLRDVIFSAVDEDIKRSKE